MDFNTFLIVLVDRWVHLPLGPGFFAWRDVFVERVHRDLQGGLRSTQGGDRRKHLRRPGPDQECAHADCPTRTQTRTTIFEITQTSTH
jgi:hypothetical protein